jgi:hypothetical protein
VHDPGTEVAAEARKRVKPVQERVYDRPAVEARTRMDCQPRRFVDGYGGGILVEYCEWNIFRLRP